MAATANLLKSLTGLLLTANPSTAQPPQGGVEEVCPLRDFSTVLKDPEIFLSVDEVPGQLNLTVTTSDPARAAAVRQALLGLLNEKAMSERYLPHNGYGLPDQ